jgi:hypothetical protein
LSFHNSYSYLKKIDQLPTGPEWHCDIVTVQGDILDDNRLRMVEDLEVWFRDPVECVRELLSNPAFVDYTSFAPECVYSDSEGKERIFDEMWTGDWWWETQVRQTRAGEKSQIINRILFYWQDKLPEGATIAPIILSSDKTQLSVFQGDKSAWPVYITIGNISKEVRRQPSAHATILLGYLPVAKLECFKDATRSLAGYRLFHYCMSKILAGLVNAGNDGVEITCCDGYIRLFYLILAAYVADFPEQCLVGCSMENRCPDCITKADERGNYVKTLYRDQKTTLDILEEHRKGGDPVKFDQYGIRAIYEPFWKDLPHSNIFKSFTPDLLHQLHKGVFKDHLVKWCTAVMGEAEVDARFKAMSSYPGLRHFKKGVSFVTQWTGTEHKEMERIFMGVLAGAVNSKVLTIARSLLDFIYYSQFQLHTSSTLEKLEKTLKTFHENKQIFIELGIRKHFNIPKLHAIQHYVEKIRYLGSPDGYNTEAPERLHIDYAKAAYRASNKRDYTEQMSIWLQRQEAMWMKQSYLMWVTLDLPSLLKTSGTDEANVVERDIDDEGHGEDDTGAVTLCDLPTSTIGRIWQVAKTPPYANMSAEQLAIQFGAQDFISQLSIFLGTRSTFSPNSLDRFNAYRQVKLVLPPNRYVSNQTRSNRIRTTPAVPRKGRRPASLGHFDVALVIVDRKLFQEGNGYDGLHFF